MRSFIATNVGNAVLTGQKRHYTHAQGISHMNWYHLMHQQPLRMNLGDKKFKTLSTFRTIYDMENNSVVGTLRNIPPLSSPGLTDAAATALHRQEFHFLLVSTERRDNGKKKSRVK